MQITIVFPFRNRDSLRVKKALDSVMQQSQKGFKVLFIDYGSTTVIAREVEKIVAQYHFVQYHYLFTQYQPWNKSKALNYALRQTNTPFFFVADIDMIFRHDFIEKTIQLLKEGIIKNVYFKVGFLSALETKLEKKFEDYQIKFESNFEATGLTLFSTSELKSCGGFDEFFHFWGAEDTDIHVRFQNAGYSVAFYDNEILMLHQWHKSYRIGETDILQKELQLKGVVQLNHHHLISNQKKGVIMANFKTWGETVSAITFNELNDFNNHIIINNTKESVTHFLFVELPQFQNGILSVCFKEYSFENSIKYKLKKIAGKKVPNYFSLKEINDMLLLHIISFYHHLPYTFTISDDLKSICFKIKKESI